MALVKSEKLMRILALALVLLQWEMVLCSDQANIPGAVLRGGNGRRARPNLPLADALPPPPVSSLEPLTVASEYYEDGTGEVISGVPIADSLDSPLPPGHVVANVPPLQIARDESERPIIAIPEQFVQARTKASQAVGAISSRWSRFKVGQMSAQERQADFRQVLDHCNSYQSYKRLKAHIRLGVDIEHLSGSVLSPLTIVSRYSPECTRILLEAGALVNQRYGRRIPRLAVIEAASSCPDCLEVLLAFGADVSMVLDTPATKNPPTALIAAATACSVRSVELVLSARNDPRIDFDTQRHCSALFETIASTQEHPEECNQVLQLLVGASADTQRVCEKTGATSISFAAGLCLVDSVEILARRTDLRTSLPGIPSPGIIATPCEDTKASAIVTALVGAGLDVNASGRHSPLLIFACRFRKPGLIRTLLDLHASINVVGVRGTTPLLAVALGDEETTSDGAEAARLVIQAGAAVDTEYESNIDSEETALIAAAKTSSSAVMEVLLEAGANPNFRSRNNNFALRAAIWYECVECVRVLAEGGASMNGRKRLAVRNPRASYSNIQVPPLAHAIIACSPKMITALINHGSSVDSKTGDGVSMISMALLVQNETPETVAGLLAALIAKGATVTKADLELLRGQRDRPLVIAELIKSGMPLMTAGKGETPFLEQLVEDNKLQVIFHLISDPSLREFMDPVYRRPSSKSKKSFLQLLKGTYLRPHLDKITKRLDAAAYDIL